MFTGISTNRFVPVSVRADRVKVASKATKEKDIREALYTVSTGYRNNIHKPISIIPRLGFSVTLPRAPASRREEPELLVDVRFTFKRNVTVDIQGLLSKDRMDIDDPEMKALYDALNDSRENLVIEGNQCYITYSIPQSLIEDHGGTVHIDNLDIVVSLVDTTHLVHPASQEGRELIEESRSKDEGFVYKVKINDPHDVYGDRFINLMDTVYKVAVTRDMHLKAGVWLKTPRPQPSTAKGYVSEYYSFTEAEKSLKLFKTVSDAKAYGDSSAYKLEVEAQSAGLKRSMAEREHEIKLAQLQHEEDVQRSKRETAMLEQEYRNATTLHKQETAKLEGLLKERDNVLKAEKMERDHALELTKHRMEQRSYERKDSSEMLKYLPVLFGAGFALSRLLAK